MDEKTGAEILELLKELSRERLVVVVTHDREYAEKYGDRIIELSDGEIISDSKKGFVYEKERQVEWRKPKLPLKTAVKVGCSNFKYHPIRLVFTILLSVIAFTLLGVSLAVGLNGFNDVAYKSMSRGDISHSAVIGYGADGMPKRVSEEEMRSLGLDLFGAAYFEADFGAEANDFYHSVLPQSVASLTYGCAEKFGFSVTGKLPESDNEIGLTAHTAETLKFFGKLPSQGDITGSTVIINGQIYVLSCVIDTHFNEKKYETLKNSAIDDYSPLIRQYVYEMNASAHGILFVSDGSLRDICGANGGGYDYLLATVDGADSPFISVDGEYRYYNSVMFELINSLGTVNGIKTLTGILSVIFALFAVGLLLNFLFVSVSDKSHTVGILKGLGCGNGGLIKIFACEGVIIGGGAFVLSSVLTAVICAAVSRSIFLKAGMTYLAIAELNPFAIPLLFVIIGVFTAVGCIAPVIRLARLTPKKCTSVI